MDDLKSLNKLINMVNQGLTEIGCPDYNKEHECSYFGRQNEYGKCYRDDWYNCPLWKNK